VTSPTAGPGARPIIVAVADVAVSEPALRYAGDEAVRGRRPVLLVHVLTDPTVPDAEQLLDGAADRVRELTRGRVTVDVRVEAPPLLPALETLSRDAALVVLQRRRRTRLQRQLVASVSSHVAGTAHAPTVWVPEDWAPCDAVEPRVVVGVDGAQDEGNRELLRRAFTRADELGATLSVLHGWQLSSGYDESVIDRAVVDDWAARYQQALRHRLSGPRAGHPQVVVGVEIVHLPPAEALVRRSKDSVLLVLGRGRLAHPLVGHLGSVARGVMRDAACPVEIIPD
jgi:nucleotide-binding universal stress UspA family protein